MSAAIHEKILIGHTISLYHNALETAGYQISIEYDFEEWWRFVASTGEVGPNWTFDPRRFDLSNGDGLYVTASVDGNWIAVAACRVFRTENFSGLVANAGLWWPRLPIGAKRTHVHPSAKALSIRGVVSHGGGGMVLPGFRGRGLPNFLVRWAQLEGYLRWRPHWDTGVLKQDPPPGRDLARKYGYPIEVPLVAGYSTARDGPARLNLVAIRRDQLIDRARHDAARLVENDGISLRDQAAGLVDWTDQPNIRAVNILIDNTDTLI